MSVTAFPLERRLADEQRARRQRLWFNGYSSPELRVASAPELRRRALDQIEKTRRIDRWRKAWELRKELEASQSYQHLQPIQIVEPPLLSPSSLITVQAITKAVCRHFGISMIDIISSRRDQRVVRPRYIVVYLARELAPLRSFAELGRMLGGRDHSTCIHGYTKVKALMDFDAELRVDVDTIRAMLVPAEQPTTG